MSSTQHKPERHQAVHPDAGPPGLTKARQPCPICGESDATVIAERARDGEAMTTLVCAGCGVGRTDPMPSPEDLERFYEEEYRLAYKGVQTPRKRHVLRAARLAVQRLALLRQYLDQKASLLDLGAGGGEFVWMARAAGFDARGIEPNAGYAGYASQVLGLPVRKGFWQLMPATPESFDAITLFHVLEHLPAPVTCLATLHGWLKPGGVLMVEVPNLCAPLGSKRRRFHRAHLLHFSPQPLAAISRRCGFEVLRVGTDRDEANVQIIARKPLQEAVSDSDGTTAPDSAGTSSAFSPRLAEDVITRWNQISPYSPTMLAGTARRFGARLWRMAEEAITMQGSRDAASILVRQEGKSLPAIDRHRL